MHKVYVLGDANVDIVVHFPKFLNKERTLVEYDNPQIAGGGTSANTAVALAKLGVGVSFVGTIGDDQYGRFVRDDFKSQGIDTSSLVVDPATNTVGVFAFIDEYGERYLWGWPRHDQSFKVIEETAVPFDGIRKADWLHSSGMSLVYDTSARKSITKAFKVAHEAGVPTSFDLNSRVDNGKLDPDFHAALLEIVPYVDYLLGSGPEEFAHFGNGTWRENAAAMAKDGHVIIARDGSRGSVAFIDGKAVESPAFKVEVQDTVGAGDDYNAGFVAAMLSGASIENALVWGNAVSGYSVENFGARSTPTQQELKVFMDTHDTRKD